MSKVFKFQVVDNLFRKNTKTINAYCEVQGDKLIMVKEYTQQIREDGALDTEEQSDDIDLLIQKALGRVDESDQEVRTFTYKERQAYKIGAIASVSMFSIENQYEDFDRTYFVRLDDSEDFTATFRSEKNAKEFFDFINTIF